MNNDLKKLFKEKGFEFKIKTTEGFSVYKKKPKVYRRLKKESNIRYIIKEKKEFGGVI